MANSRCPSRSIAMKNTNHVAIERKYCTIVKHEMLSILSNSLKSKLVKWFKPYFILSIYKYVYVIQKSVETASAITEAMAAPFKPNSGNPKCPNISA
jgi:hypothetical protein